MTRRRLRALAAPAALATACVLALSTAVSAQAVPDAPLPPEPPALRATTVGTTAPSESVSPITAIPITAAPITASPIAAAAVTPTPAVAFPIDPLIGILPSTHPIRGAAPAEDAAVEDAALDDTALDDAAAPTARAAEDAAAEVAPEPSVTAAAPPEAPLPPALPAARMAAAAAPVAAQLAAPADIVDPVADAVGMIEMAALPADFGALPLPRARPAVIPPRTTWDALGDGPPAYDQVAMLLPPAMAPRGATGSAGCGRAGSSGTIDVAGRRVIVDLPGRYDSARATRLILAFHGRTGTPEQVRRYYNLDDDPRTPAIIAYPRASGAGWGGSVDADLAFVDALIAEMSRRFCVDTDQLFAVGHSMGGSFANTLACARPQTFRAVASVAGGGSVIGRCQASPVAQILLHNPSDDFVDYGLSEGELRRRLAQNGLTQTVSARSDVPFPCRRYGATALEPVVFCDLPSTFNRQGRIYRHGWPGGTADAILAFFDALPPRI